MHRSGSLQKDTSRNSKYSLDETPEFSLGEVWSRVKRRLRAELGEDVYVSWFGRLEIENVCDGCARLSVPTRFLKSWIEAHYQDRVLSVCRQENKAIERLVITVRGAVAQRDTTALNKPLETHPRAVTEIVSLPFTTEGLSKVTSIAEERGDATEMGGAPLEPRFTFDAFVVGRANKLAHAAAERVAESKNEIAVYNPLFIHAGVGLGKTHLLHAVGHVVRNSGRRVIYLTADRFMYGFVAALKTQNALAFKERLRAIDLLIIDDVQFIQGKSIQQEFGHTINALIDAGKQVLVAADRPPMDLESLDERVRSRLAGGLVVEVSNLDDDLRASILQSRIAALRPVHPGFDVSPAVVSYVARTISTNGRDLEGAVNRLLAHVTLTGTPITIETAEAAIRDLVRNRDPKRVKIEDIQKLVASRYNVSRSDILSERRTAAVVRPRQIAMYLAKVLTLRSLPEIGRRFGGRDHTTVLHAVRKIEKALNEDVTLSDEVELLKRMLQE